MKLSYKIALFLLLSVVIDRAVGYFISHHVQAFQYDNRIEKIINHEIDAKTLVIGSSRALIDVDACVLSEELNRKVYNLGFSGSTVDFHLFVLQLLEHTQQFPDTCLLVLDESKTLIGSENAFFRTDFLMPYVADDFIYKKVCEKEKSVYPVGLISNSYRQNNNTLNTLIQLVSGQKEPDNTSNINSCGSVLIQDQAPTFTSTEPKPAKDYLLTNENPKFIDAFKAIVDICDKHNTELILVYPPNYYRPNPEFKKRIEEISQGNTQSIYLDDNIPDNTHFYDAGHLKSNGSLVFSTALANQIMRL